MRFLFVLLLLASAPRAHADAVECMARVNGNWTAQPSDGIVVTPDYCSADFTYPTESSSQSYHLTHGPLRNASRVVCQWSWQPSHPEQPFPGPSTPRSFVCYLYLSPEGEYP